MVLEVVLDFPAGYALYDSSSKNVTPRPGTGHIIVSKDSDDPYYYFTWEPRDGFTPTEEISAREPLLLIPGDASWVHISKCTSGRVFALKFESSDKREFFWMQTKNDSKDKNLGALSRADKEVMETFQKCLTEDEQDDEEDDEDEDMADVNTHSTKEEPSNASKNSESAGSSNLSSLLQTINNQVRQRQQQQQQLDNEFPVLSVSNAFSPSDFIQYVNSLDSKELEPLLKVIPEGLGNTKEDLIRVLRSSQFAQNAESLSTVLRQGTLGNVIAHEMKYPYSGEGVEGYLNGIYRSQEETREKQKKAHEDKPSEK